MLSKSTLVVSDEPHREAAVVYLNIIIGRDDRSGSFWNTNVREDLAKMFTDVLTSDEQRCENFQEYVRTHLNYCSVMSRLLKCVGIKMGKKSYKQMDENPLEYEFVVPDIKRINSKMTHLKLATYADGMLNLYAGLKSKTEYGRQRFIFTAREKMLDLFTCSKPLTAASLTEIYMQLFKLGKLEDRPLNLQNFEAAAAMTMAMPNCQNDLKAKVLYFIGKNAVLRYKQKENNQRLSDLKKSKFDLLRVALSYCIAALALDSNCTNAARLRDKITDLRGKDGDDMNIDIKAANFYPPTIADPAVCLLQFRKQK